MTRGPPQHVQKYVTHTVTQGHCPTSQTSPTYIAMNAMAVPAKPHQMEIWGILPTKEEHPMDGPNV